MHSLDYLNQNSWVFAKNANSHVLLKTTQIPRGWILEIFFFASMPGKPYIHSSLKTFALVNQVSALTVHLEELVNFKKLVKPGFLPRTVE